jgi:hypothetical protein
VAYQVLWDPPHCSEGLASINQQQVKLLQQCLCVCLGTAGQALGLLAVAPSALQSCVSSVGWCGKGLLQLTHLPPLSQLLYTKPPPILPWFHISLQSWMVQYPTHAHLQHQVFPGLLQDGLQDGETHTD